MEEVQDEDANPRVNIPPKNPQHILERSDGSDDGIDIAQPRSTAKPKQKRPAKRKAAPVVESSDDSDTEEVDVVEKGK